MPPARARARRSLMADDDEPPTASTSALRSAWVDDPPFPPLPRAARNVSPAEVVVDAVAVMPAEGPADATAQHRATHQRRATPAEHLFMLRRYEDENPQQHFRLDVMHTCIGAAYPDAVVSDVRYQSAMTWFRQLEVMKPGDESSGGVLSCARKRSAALARAPACRGRALEAESRSRAREEAGVRGARVRQCGSGGGGSDGSYLCTRHRRDATMSSASMRTPR
jgi:hypothetical protein